MAHVSSLIEKDIRTYLKSHEAKSLLRFITCGSVDDGKSTLIGRLLFDSKMIFEDQLKSLEADSRKFGTQGERIDLALLVDGLAAEREQGITIDVAYRFFSTDRRKFIVADTPGHEQYTRNMVTGASTADLAVVLVDARKGILTQTKRHTTLVNLVGITEIVLAVNKMDLLGYDRSVYDKILEDYGAFAVQLGITKFTAIPISALEGDNITSRSVNTSWYNGPTLMGYLETVPVQKATAATKPFRFPVQWVNRPNPDFRGFTGTVTTGTAKKGAIIRVMPSGKETKIKDIVFYKDYLNEATTGQAITITLEDEVDVSRGDVLCDRDHPTMLADQFEATIFWMADSALRPGRRFGLKCGTTYANGTVTKIKSVLNPNTLERHSSGQLTTNDVATCNISTDRPLTFDKYSENKELGSFIIIDEMTNTTTGAGIINFGLMRAANLTCYKFGVTKKERAFAKKQTPKLIWIVGLSGAGKSTIGNLLEQELHSRGKHTYILDGDNIRLGLNRDLGFSETDRIENIRRVGEVAKLMVDAGLIVLATFISPFQRDRDMVRSHFEDGEFYEIFIDTPIEKIKQRDPKGLYARAQDGQVKNLPGVDFVFEKPLKPNLIIHNDGDDPRVAVRKILESLAELR